MPNTQKAGAGEPLPPFNEEFEQAFLGSILIDPACLRRVADLVAARDFHIIRHSIIFAVLLDMFRKEAAIDLVTVTDALTQRNLLNDMGGPAYLTGLINATPTSFHVDYYGRRIVDYARLRRLLAGAGRLARAIYRIKDPEKALVEAEKILGDMNRELPAPGQSEEEIEQQTGLRPINEF